MLLFENLIYKCICKARELAPKDEKNRIKLNGYMHWFIDKYYFQNQSIAIRRLIDGGKDSISLRKIIENMKKHKDLLTRSNYCRYLNIPLDYSELIIKEQEYISKHLKFGEVICIPDDIDPSPSQDFHAAFDKLAGVNAPQRSPSDNFSKTIFEKLLSCLDNCNEFARKVSKTIAHTSLDSYSNPPVISYGDIQDAHKILCGVCHFIGLNFLGRISYSMFIQPTAGWLRYVTEPLISKEHKNELFKILEDHRAKIQQWESVYNKSLF